MFRKDTPMPTTTSQQKQPTILICTPCYGNSLMTGYFQSVIQLFEVLGQHNIRFAVHTIGNESLVQRGRNYFTSIFLSNPEFTHLFFIDADITFNPISVVRLVQSGYPICGGAYPKKEVMWKRIPELLKHNPDMPSDELEARSYDYAINILTKQNPNVNVNIPIENGFMKVDYLSTGFLMIQREVIETMTKKFPELKYTNDISGYDNGKNTECFYALFDGMICPVSHRYLSEDYTFCERALQLGYNIFMDLSCDLTHFGSYPFRGSIIKSLFTKDDLQKLQAKSAQEKTSQ